MKFNARDATRTLYPSVRQARCRRLIRVLAAVALVMSVLSPLRLPAPVSAHPSYEVCLHFLGSLVNGSGQRYGVVYGCSNGSYSVIIFDNFNAVGGGSLLTQGGFHRFARLAPGGRQITTLGIGTVACPALPKNLRLPPGVPKGTALHAITRIDVTVTQNSTHAIAHGTWSRPCPLTTSEWKVVLTPDPGSKPFAPGPAEVYGINRSTFHQWARLIVLTATLPYTNPPAPAT